ncbi:hypothetical protein [Mycolicibacterium stellerae]|uniref:hypothetical protein n=1 Tax=Mycolicibacterium stellerae TaxID=2358193 RepID=UPI0013DE3D23|nr:hypothetical protein [Mycolicibacterium stellerae]
MLNTDPASVLTELGRVGADDNPARAKIEPSPLRSLGLVDLETLVMMTGFRWDADPRHEWVLHGEMAIRMALALDDCKFGGDQYTRFGHSPVAAARILLHSRGRCIGCDRRLDLDFDDAREHIHIHTVDAYRRDTLSAETKADWPGAPVCALHSMHAEGRIHQPGRLPAGPNIPPARRVGLNRLDWRSSGC